MSDLMSRDFAVWASLFAKSRSYNYTVQYRYTISLKTKCKIQTW